MIAVLLSNTEVTVQIGSTSSRNFSTTVGTAQGDFLSPLLFVIYLEAALRDLRLFYNGQITEIVYADDVDFVSHDTAALRRLLDVSPAELGKWFLTVNTTKTEITEVARMSSRLDDVWRHSRKLGTLLGDSEDITRRKVLSTAALNRLKTYWVANRPVTIALRLRLYNAFVKPVLLYNSSCWGISASKIKNLNSFHRRQLRILCGVQWPTRINNGALYRKCSAQPVILDVMEARWRLFGHVLRMDQTSPANLAMEEYFAASGKKFRGRPRNTLPEVLDADLKSINRKLKNGDDLDAMRILACNRGG
ncbi:uncharacterized protein LOC115228424 [Octopus sinensis]|uniref:Uncharacterized protein LOC115228424 n=1 Tax=Octopus sinensis TaxID=2607531 RepID=A0A6P7U1M6_9MOLL|nr:uncharacterized protein LOC115228424 [Octopus sinensis]